MPSSAPDAVPSRAPDLVSGAVLLALTLLLAWETLVPLPEGIEAARNPVWYPRILLGLAGVASAGLLLRGLVGRGLTVPRPRYGRLAGVTAVLAVYFWVFGSAGFLLASAVLIPILAIVLGYRRIALAVLVSVLFCTGVWYVFAEVFVVRPPGAGVDTVLQLVRGA